MTRPHIVSNILTIAGTDPSGGAGIQADLKTISALGHYGLSVITAVVAQNTCGVRCVTPMTPDCVAAQIDAVFDDVQISAVKIGMLHDAGIIHAVADRLTRYRPKWIVLDPVMIAKSGAPLLEPTAIHALKAQLLPLSTVITPNLPEAATLLETGAAESDAAIHAQLNRLLRLGPQAVLIKGGHSNDPAHSTDWLLEADNAHDQLKSFTSQRICTRNDHGTGCTLSSAIAALLPQNTLTSAIRHAKAYLQAALEASDQISVGNGHGPLHHFHNLWPAR